MYIGYIISAKRLSAPLGFIRNIAFGTNSPVRMIIIVDINVSRNRRTPVESVIPDKIVAFNSFAIRIPYMTRTMLLPTRRLETKLLLLE